MAKKGGQQTAKGGKGGKTTSKHPAKGGKPAAAKGAKAKKKKWSKGKVKERANNAVRFDQATYDMLLKEVPSYKLITPSILSTRLKINGSLARQAIKELMAKGLIRMVSSHNMQTIYTRASSGETGTERRGLQLTMAPEDFTNEINGMTFHAMAQYFKDVFGITDAVDDIVQEWNDMAREEYRTEVPLKVAGVKMGIGTSNVTPLVDIVLERFGLREFVDDCIVCGDNGVLKGKPDPEIFLKTAEKMGLSDHSKILVFEDSLGGVLAAGNAGMRCVSVHDAESAPVRARMEELSDSQIATMEEIVLQQGSFVIGRHCYVFEDSQ